MVLQLKHNMPVVGVAEIIIELTGIYLLEPNTAQDYTSLQSFKHQQDSEFQYGPFYHKGSLLKELKDKAPRG